MHNGHLWSTYIIKEWTWRNIAGGRMKKHLMKIKYFDHLKQCLDTVLQQRKSNILRNMCNWKLVPLCAWYCTEINVVRHEQAAKYQKRKRQHGKGNYIMYWNAHWNAKTGTCTKKIISKTCCASINHEKSQHHYWTMSSHDKHNGESTL